MPAYPDTNPTTPIGPPARSRYSGLNRTQRQPRMTRGNTIMVWTVGILLLFTIMGAIGNTSDSNSCPAPSHNVTSTK